MRWDTAKQVINVNTTWKNSNYSNSDDGCCCNIYFASLFVVNFRLLLCGPNSFVIAVACWFVVLVSIFGSQFFSFRSQNSAAYGFFELFLVFFHAKLSARTEVTIVKLKGTHETTGFLLYLSNEKYLKYIKFTLTQLKMTRLSRTAVLRWPIVPISRCVRDKCSCVCVCALVSGRCLRC